MSDSTKAALIRFRLIAAPTQETVIEAIRDIVVTLVGSEALAIFVLDRSGTTLSLLYSHGVDAEPLRAIPVGAGDIGRVVATGQPYVTDDPENSSSRNELTACFPLKRDKQITGALAIFGLLPQRDGLGGADRELLDVLATLAGTALHRTTLAAETA